MPASQITEVFLLAALIAAPAFAEDAPDAGDPPDAGFEAPLAAPSPEAPDAGPAEAPAAEPKALESVVVGTTEERTAGSVHTIKSSKLNRFELDDPAAVLQAVPGVYARGEDGFGLRPNIGLRGANSDRSKKVTLMEDGILQGPAPYSAPAAYYFPLITRMESVRVVKGPGAIMYGPHTVGGAVDLITRDAPSGLVAGLDAAAGEHLAGKVHGYFGGGDANTSFLLEGVLVRNGGFKQLDGGGDAGFTRTEWMAKGRHRLDALGRAHTFTLKLGYSTEVSNESYLGLSDADFRATPLRRYGASALDQMNWHRSQVELSHRTTLGPFEVHSAFYRHDFDRTWRKVNRFAGAAIADILDSPTNPRDAVYFAVLSGQADSASPGETLRIGPNKRGFVAQGFQTNARAAFSTGPLKHALELSGRYHFDSAERLHTEDAFVMRSGRPVFAGEPTYTIGSNRDASHAVALHANDAIAWGGVTVTPGVRVELIRSETKDKRTGAFSRGQVDVVLPGIGAHWQIFDPIGVFAGAYRGFSPPPPGQGALQPESSISAEAGARWTRRQERLEVIGFFNDYENLTALCTFSDGCVTENLDRQFDAGAAYIYGLEAYGEKTWRIGGLKIPTSFAYTFTQTQLLESFVSGDPQLGTVTAGDELPYVPKHQLNLSVGVEVWRVGAHAQFNFVDRMREQAGSGDFVPGLTTDVQAVLDLHLGFKANDCVSVYFDVRNAMDQRALVGRRPFGARPNAPRQIMGGLKLTY